MTNPPVPQGPPADHSGEDRPLIPAPPPPPVLGGFAGPGMPSPAGPGMPPPGLNPPPKKKSKVGLIIGIVALVLVLCCGGGIGGGWYFLFDGDEIVNAWMEEDPGYPQSYTAQVEPVSEAKYYDPAYNGEGSDLCAEIGTDRFDQVIALESASPQVSTTSDEWGDYSCTIELNNRDTYPHNGDLVTITVYAMVAPTEDAAAERFAQDSGSGDPVDGLEVTAVYSESNSDPHKYGGKLEALHGNLEIVVSIEVNPYSAPGEADPGVSAEVWKGLGADTVNELLAALPAK